MGLQPTEIPAAEPLTGRAKVQPECSEIPAALTAEQLIGTLNSPEAPANREAMLTKEVLPTELSTGRAKEQREGAEQPAALTAEHPRRTPNSPEVPASQETMDSREATHKEPPDNREVTLHREAPVLREPMQAMPHREPPVRDSRERSPSAPIRGQYGKNIYRRLRQNGCHIGKRKPH